MSYAGDSRVRVLSHNAEMKQVWRIEACLLPSTTDQMNTHENILQSGEGILKDDFCRLLPLAYRAAHVPNILVGYKRPPSRGPVALRTPLRPAQY